MHNSIEIVDRGRGLQLSTSRITVQDLVPYLQRGCGRDEIRRWIPSLTTDEIAVVERYYQENQVRLDEEDQRIQAYRAEQIRMQRLRFPDDDQETRLARIRKLAQERREGKNGERHPG